MRPKSTPTDSSRNPKRPLSSAEKVSPLDKKTKSSGKKTTARNIFEKPTEEVKMNPNDNNLMEVLNSIKASVARLPAIEKDVSRLQAIEVDIADVKTTLSDFKDSLEFTQ